MDGVYFIFIIMVICWLPVWFWALALALALPRFVFGVLCCETRRMREAGSLCEDAAWISFVGKVRCLGWADGLSEVIWIWGYFTLDELAAVNGETEE